MPPLADAMGLVHDQPSRPGPRERGTESRVPEPLRGHVDQIECARPQSRLRRLALGRRHAGVQRGRRQSARTQRVHLVFHQCDERRDHDGGTVEQQRGKLKAERLARPGGHHGDQVPALEHRLRGLALTGTECRETKPLVQGAVEVGRGERKCGGEATPESSGGPTVMAAGPPRTGPSLRENPGPFTARGRPCRQRGRRSGSGRRSCSARRGHIRIGRCRHGQAAIAAGELEGNRHRVRVECVGD